MNELQFEFRLTPLDRHVPWDRQRPVSWFELTDGEQIVRVGDERVFEMEILEPKDAARTQWLNYSVVRLWEDLLDLLPHAMDPVPPDMARRLDPEAQRQRWRDRAWEWLRTRSGEEVDEVELAFSWDSLRTLDVGHLVAAPRLSFVCIDDRAIVTCEPRGDTASMGWRWTCGPARIELPKSQMSAEIARFAHALVEQMAARIDAISEGALEGRAVVDIAALRERHAGYERRLADALVARPEQEDWDRIRRALRVIDDAIGA